MAAVSSLIALGIAGYGAYKSITDKGPEAPIVPPPPAPADLSTPAAAGVARRARAPRRDPSLLTGPLGVATPAPVTRKTLLGS